MNHESRPDLVGDGYDAEPLWTANQVSEFLQVPVKNVYELPIPSIRLSRRRRRWRPKTVIEYAMSREV